MTSLTIENQVKIAEKICGQFSKKTNISSDDLLSVALEKLPTIEKNFIPALNDNYSVFLKRSLKGYLSNYVRDHGFTVKIPRKTTEIYMKTRKYASYKIASVHTKWSETQIRNAHEIVNKHRSYNTSQLKSWNTSIDTLSENNHLNDAQNICRESGINTELLFDFFLYGLSNDELVSKYGSNALIDISSQSMKLKHLAIQQGYNES